MVKRVAADLVRPRSCDRPKQPYRAPDARAFVGTDAPPWVSEVLDESTVARAGIFDPSRDPTALEEGPGAARRSTILQCG